ncbi:RNA-directed DNA polymerase from mobile element jockey [Trichonephila clavipes]|nr:RNA-directed DNA polymerase from mobile element jockey [Trichonephila clavipes]
MNSVTHHINQGIQCSRYVDDVQISYSSKFLNVAERHIQTTINNFTKWAEQNGFVFSREKTVIVVFSRKHLKIRSAKALNILKVLANTRWGADRTSLLRLYRALIRSKLDYESVVYSSACKSLLKILDPVHHQALRLCLGAFRTSPVESLYAEAYEPPLDLRRNLYDFNSHRSSLTYSQSFHFRIRDLINDLNLNIGRLTLCKISEVPPWKVIYPKVDFTLSCYSKACTPESTYKTQYLEHRELFSDNEPIFTDGSKSESHVTSAVVSLSTILCQPFKAFSLHSSSHPILVDITYALANHFKKKDNRFCSIPGHAGITGNELADTAARSATGSSERFPIPHSGAWPVMPMRRTDVKLPRLRIGHTRFTHKHLLLGEDAPECPTATAGSDVTQSGRPIFDDFFQHLWPYIGNNTANVVFQMVKHLWLIRIDQ